MTTLDGPWTVAPNGVQYQVLGEEGDEELLIHGHKLGHLASIETVIRHAGFGRALDPIMDGEFMIVAGTTVAELQPFETWAHELRDCPAHGWVPLWVRMVLRPRLPALEKCLRCEFVIHYRTCQGCGFCSSDGSGVAPPFWEWITPEHRLAYLPGELETIHARINQINSTGEPDSLGGGIVLEPRVAAEFRALVDGSRDIRRELSTRGFVPVTIVSVGG